ncbi:MAG TPA: S4 domain-containing protein, partial [Pyrinomonadaceae bacterium]|nr:S4 domain-containing protein [Pyrinomonadaceae bacterium]
MGHGATEQDAETLTLRVPDEDSGTRLDTYLAAQIAGWSRTRIKRLIEDGDVLVGGRVAKPSYQLRAGDEIEVELATPPPAALVPENIQLEILFEDNDLVVVNKHAGMLVHPGAGAASGTLANALAYHFQHLSRRA